MKSQRSKGKKPDASSEEVRAAIVDTARKHFAMHGFNGAALKDIASETGIASSLINYHFKDKEGLFKECIEPFARGRMEAISRIMSEPNSPEELKVRIQLFVQEMQSAILSDILIFETIDRELRSANPVALKVFEETMLLAFRNVASFFSQAQENGLIGSSKNPVILASVLFTSTCDAVRKEFLAKRFFNLSFMDGEFSRQYATQVADLFINGVLK